MTKEEAKAVSDSTIEAATPEQLGNREWRLNNLYWIVDKKGNWERYKPPPSIGLSPIIATRERMQIYREHADMFMAQNIFKMEECDDEAETETEARGCDGLELARRTDTLPFPFRARLRADTARGR
jgi:hypothetical protein